MVEYLQKLLADFVYLQYKIHSIHTDIVGALFLDYHPFLDEVYKFFWDDTIDLVKERVRILWGETPNTLAELAKMKTVEELKDIPDIPTALEIVMEDLTVMCYTIQHWEEMADEMKDFVTMNMLTDFHATLWKLEWKNRSVLWKR